MNRAAAPNLTRGLSCLPTRRGISSQLNCIGEMICCGADLRCMAAGIEMDGRAADDESPGDERVPQEGGGVGGLTGGACTSNRVSCSPVPEPLAEQATKEDVHLVAGARTA